MLDKARLIFPLFGAKYKEAKRVWVFKNGATLKFRYLDKDKDADNYQGHEYTWMGFDEAGSWPFPEPLDKLRACLRSPHRIPVRLVLTGNPGGRGHNWLKMRYIDPVPPSVVQRIDVEGTIWTRVFIPAKVHDNKILLKSDPGYISRLKSSGPAWLVKAWLDGNWDIVAGGALDDVWKRSVHVLEPFVIPNTWYIDRSFDWGSSKPFSVGWWAESDGCSVQMADGSARTFPAKTLFRIAEWYGWNGTPNKGLGMLNTVIAKKIVDIENNQIKKSFYGRNISSIKPGPADSSIFDAIDGKCMANDFANSGCRWTKADKGPGSRIAGLEKFRSKLTASLTSPMEEPGIFVFDTCNNGFIRTIPTLPRDERNPDDVDTNSEDHCFDETRYRLYRKSSTVTVVRTTHF